jgi:hypothetical protein
MSRRMPSRSCEPSAPGRPGDHGVLEGVDLLGRDRRAAALGGRDALGRVVALAPARARTNRS